MHSALRTRIAPTPSGYLHLGNALNFALIALWAQSHGAELGLRIDDIDTQRCRLEYIEDVYSLLHWLQIQPSWGPRDLRDLEENFSQRLDRALHEDLLERLRSRKLVYACDCSRSQRDRFSAEGAYHGHCRERGLRFAAGQNCLRLRCEVPGPQTTWLERMQDFVIWTKEDRPAYQLVSVAADYRDKVDMIIRGEDLRDSSAAQIYLAHCLGPDYEESFRAKRFYHHPLRVTEEGQKLSKSDSALSMKELIAKGYTLKDFLTDFEKFFGITVADKSSAYLKNFRGSLFPNG